MKKQFIYNTNSNLIHIKGCFCAPQVESVHSPQYVFFENINDINELYGNSVKMCYFCKKRQNNSHKRNVR